MLASSQHSASERVFIEFAEWAESYLVAAPAERRALEEDGAVLAQKRQDTLIDLIQADPKRALELALPSQAGAEFPERIRNLVEERVSARGNLNVLAVLPELGEEGTVPPVFRKAEIGAMTYDAFVYGRRLGQPSRRGIPLAGIVLNGLMAVAENPVRVLSDLEARQAPLAATPAVCPMDGDVIVDGSALTLVEVGGDLVRLCCEEHAALFVEDLLAAEERGVGSSQDAATAPSAWTEGIKKLLLIRVDFSDLSGEPLSEADGTNLVRTVHEFYQEMSYQKAGFALMGDGSDITPTFRMPETARFYGGLDASRLRTDARAAARTAGYILSSYDLDVICFGQVPGFRFAGLAYVGAAGAWLRDSFSTGVAAPEFGYNFGLNHANFWATSGQSVIGTGASVEYGDTFDTMGSANAGPKHFNARYKNLLNWLPTADVKTVTESGLYQIAAFDDPAATGTRALKLVKNSRTNYWVEFRQRYTNNRWLMDGVSIRWAGNGNESSRLLDTTAGSVAGKDDAALVFGRTFSDQAAGLHITPLRKLGTQPESVEVAVNKGSFSENRPPVVQVTGDTNAPTIAATLTFAASATDADGDPLAYAWDFGDRTFGPNAPTASHRWTAVGDYVVRCVVTDMKGGQGSDSLVVQVGRSSNVYRLSGQVAANSGPLEGVRVYASSTLVAYTDSDGRYTLTAVPPGSYTLRASLEGYTFARVNFLNPLSVGPSQLNADFVAVERDGGNTRPLVAGGSLWRFLDDGSNAGTAWRQVEFNDASWTEGPAPLGYGDDGEMTAVRFGPNSSSKYVTTYFRHAFVVDNPSAFSLLTLGLRRDDGGVVYLNAREVFRSNMPSGNLASSTLASATVGGNDEQTFFQADLDTALLRAGTNVLAVEIHQVSRTSSDLAFDLELIGIEAPRIAPPTLSLETGPGYLRLTWPESSANWTLRSADQLGAGAVWANFPGPVEVAGGQRSVRITPASGHQFFLLAPPTAP